MAGLSEPGTCTPLGSETSLKHAQSATVATRVRFPFHDPLAARQAIAEALESTGGNQTRAAKLLGISRRALVNRLQDGGFTPPCRSCGTNRGVIDGGPRRRAQQLPSGGHNLRTMRATLVHQLGARCAVPVVLAVPGLLPWRDQRVTRERFDDWATRHPQAPTETKSTSRTTFSVLILLAKNGPTWICTGSRSNP
ncbi:MAG: helix-turn-helix domain-containing protein [Polyangiaceae bacterium]|nr:helix-turn-helix domain-containing protein [Polyangiaceae bacterium]